MPAASLVFDFLEQHGSCLIDRREVASTSFAIVRRALRTIIFEFKDSDDLQAIEALNRLRGLLSEWLTTPVPFDAAFVASLHDALGSVDAVNARWGQRIGESYGTALHAATRLTSEENPIRVLCRSVIDELNARGIDYRIYCHRRARPYFESILDACGARNPHRIFLHTVRDYRESDPFEILLKVGPLRSRGWGSAPDAIVSAPRFSELIQIAWPGCNDEPEFGYDPAARTESPPDTRSGTRWTRTVQLTEQLNDRQDEGLDQFDELQAFQELDRPREARTTDVPPLLSSGAV